jgi:oligopeptide/dipeptide ABC transporter ATP-binding protein
MENKLILEVENLTKYFPSETRFLGKGQVVKAVDDISFSVAQGTTYALVGESGCGKSTTARLIMKLITATSGTIQFDGKNLFDLTKKELLYLRRDIQMIFQDPYSSLNPRWKARKIIEEPLLVHHSMTAKERYAKVLEMLEVVGLDEESGNKFPHEFSGGQRQRIGIARALITNPKFIICDEPISALDVSIQAQIINLLKKLQSIYQLTYLFITHDLRVVNYFCNEMGVMYLGKLVETGTTKDLFEKPAHPYTKALFSAIPIPSPTPKNNVIYLEGDVPSPISPPKGCRFHPRCPVAMEICSSIEPETKKIGDGHYCACHLYR